MFLDKNIHTFKKNQILLPRPGDTIEDIYLVYTANSQPNGTASIYFACSDKIDSTDVFEKDNTFIDDNKVYYKAMFEHLKGQNVIPIIKIQHNTLSVSVEDDPNFLGLYVVYNRLPNESRELLSHNDTSYTLSNKTLVYSQSIIKQIV